VRILVAPGNFKGSIKASSAAKAIVQGLLRVIPEAAIKECPLADGGEGTVEALINAVGGLIKKVEVTGPLGNKVKSFFGLLAKAKGVKTAIVEMAAASGLSLVPVAQRDPTLTTTFGTGEIIKSALNHGCRRIIIGLGDSATCDAGIGIAQALGIRLTDVRGKELSFGGRELIKLHSIDLTLADPRLKETEFIVVCDVNNPLYGPTGAAHVFAPQKGATPEQVLLLDQGLIKFALVVKRELGLDIANLSGAGAAGGLGAGLVVFLGAKLKSGSEVILEAMKFEEKLNQTDVVITGEGMLDYKSFYGKVPVKVAEKAKEKKVPVVMIVGQKGPGAAKAANFSIKKIITLLEIAGSVNEAKKFPERYLTKAAMLAAQELTQVDKLN
jgi:glycerate kinase